MQRQEQKQKQKRPWAVAVMRLAGWKVEGHLPADCAKSVFIAAPHTSNWDLPFTLMVAFVMRLNVYWMGKHQIFKFPFRHCRRRCKARSVLYRGICVATHGRLIALAAQSNSGA